MEEEPKSDTREKDLSELSRHERRKYAKQLRKETQKATGTGFKLKLGGKLYLILGAALVVAVIAAGAYFVNGRTGPLDSFAQCLTEKGVRIYGGQTCGYTHRQLLFFDSSVKYLDVVICEENLQECDSKGIRITPTWEINGKLIEEVQSLRQLSNLTGCQLPG